MKMIKPTFHKANSVLSGLLLAAGMVSSAFAETTLLENGVIHTVTKGTLTNGAVLIDGGNIKEILSSSATAGVVADHKLDLHGSHLYPGMMALDSALGLVEIQEVRATRDTTEAGAYTPDVKAWIAVNPDSELLHTARAGGILNFEPTPQGGVVAGLSGVLRMDGWTTEQMTVKKPAALQIYWPSMELDITPKAKVKDASKSKSLEDQDKERRKQLKELDEFFLEARAYDQLKKSSGATKQPFHSIPAWEAVAPAIHGEIPIVVYANEARQITAALAWAQTNHYQIILAGAREGWRVADKIAAAKVPVIFEGTMSIPTRDTDGYDAQFKAAEVYHKAGVTLALSEGFGDLGASLARNLPHTAAQCIAYGLPEDEALKAITLRPAELMGLGKTLGSIEVGKEATLFVCDGDLFDVRSKVLHAWIAGKEVSLESRHTRLYDRYRNRPK